MNDANKETMRILVFAPLGVGGVASLMLDIQKSIDRDKLNFDYLDFHNQVEEQEHIAYELGSRKMVASADEIKFKPLRGFVRFFRVKRICKNNNVKVLHFNYGSPIGFLTMLAAKLGGVKWITFHSHNGGVTNQGMLGTIVGNICRPLLNLVVDDYWACSSLAAEFSFPKKISKQKKYRFVPNGIILNKFKYDEDEREKVRKELSIEDKYVVGHAGRFNLQKNHEFLIDIFARIHEKQSNAILLLFGIGDLQDKIKEKVSSLGLSDCVRFCGASSEMNRMYQAMDVFLMPSLFEGLPVTGVEAQAAGLPIVFSDTITREVAVSPNVEYISLKDSVDIWADASLKFLDAHRKDYCDELGKKGFDKDDMVNYFQSYYLSLNQRINEPTLKEDNR